MRFRVSNILFGLFTLLLCLPMFGGCAAPGKEQDQQSDLVIAVAESRQAVPLIVAVETGTFAEAGLTVNLVPVADWCESKILLQAGAVDGVMGDLFTLARLQDQGFLVTGFSTTGERHILLTSPDRSDSFAALIGETIVLSDSIAGRYLVERLLAANQLVAGDVTFQTEGKPLLVLEAFNRAEAGAALLPAYLAETALRAGAICLADTGQLSLPGDVLLFNGEAVFEKEAQLALFYQGYREAVRFLNRHGIPEQVMLVEKWGFGEAWPGSEPGFFGEPRLLTREEVNDALAWFKERDGEALRTTFEGLVRRDHLWD